MKLLRIQTAQDRFLAERLKRGKTAKESVNELVESKLEGIVEDNLRAVAALDRDLVIIHKNCTFCESPEISYDVMTGEWSCEACKKKWGATSFKS
jgi:hypothetical protein